MTFSFNQHALDEYQRAAAWYRDDSAMAAERFIAEVEDGIREILKRPDCYQPVGDGVRVYRLKKFPYKIHYLLEDEHVTIYSVTNTKRKLDYWRGRLPGED
ncbi:MAG: type II toxin-antitoxin system RelE/ParE family toxin [Roseimicrobium sp.]